MAADSTRESFFENEQVKELKLSRKSQKDEVAEKEELRTQVYVCVYV